MPEQSNGAAAILNSQYVVVPRGCEQYSYIPGRRATGMKFQLVTRLYRVIRRTKEFVAEGLNEAGLSAGLFYFPGYGGDMKTMIPN